ncbi:10274_t:CDS:2 [Paraglomus brasilianum]|uniref:10274_t:CDS:1 n=1 Tax=Paraglomus brasilianum TaxID=144538 RepID=A0A9N8ZAW9_9GLOM|nr:10274_t:CDS:2 [Paraglomus brasilianum]
MDFHYIEPESTSTSESEQDARVVVGIDFGTTFSGFAYANKVNKNTIETHDTWPEQRGALKTPTALLYAEDWKVHKWGVPALAVRPKKKKGKGARNIDTKPVELFKLHLGDMKDVEKPPLPDGLDFRKAITDYLAEFGKLMKETLLARWPGLDFHKHILKVITVPAEFDDRAKYIMRTCAHGAGLTDKVDSELLEFTTEPEAAAIYCMKVLQQHNLKKGSSFMIVDCGGGTVDLTTRTLLTQDCLSEVTERTGDFCGGSYVDKEFVKYMRKLVGSEAIDKLEASNYSQLQYLIQEFSTQIKLQFTGEPAKFKPKELDIEDMCPALIQHVDEKTKAEMEKTEWLVELNYVTVKIFFDTVVDKILRLIRSQLNSSKRMVSALFMVGGFSESPYVLRRVREEYGREVEIIAVPSEPIAAVVRGAVYYGLNMKTIQTRVLKRTYGIEIWEKARPWDPKERRNDRGVVKLFHKLAQRGTEVAVDAKFLFECWPIYPEQTTVKFLIYTTAEDDAKYCDDPGMKLFGKLHIDLPDPHLGRNRPIDFTLTFGKMETKAIATNKRTGERCEAIFALEL